MNKNRWRLYRADIGNYMKRWILGTPWGTLRIHKIMRSDDDRALHDHPWDFRSYILSGGYVEYTPDGVANYEAGDWNRKKAEELHRLVVPDGKPVWTFVITGPIRRKWGFQTENGWVHWKEYTGEV